MSFFTKTSLIKFKEIGKRLKGDVYSKIETVKPTGLHKQMFSPHIIGCVELNMDID